MQSICNCIENPTMIQNKIIKWFLHHFFCFILLSQHLANYNVQHFDIYGYFFVTQPLSSSFKLIRIIFCCVFSVINQLKEMHCLNDMRQITENTLRDREDMKQEDDEQLLSWILTGLWFLLDWFPPFAPTFSVTESSCSCDERLLLLLLYLFISSALKTLQRSLSLSAAAEALNCATVIRELICELRSSWMPVVTVTCCYGYCFPL